MSRKIVHFPTCLSKARIKLITKGILSNPNNLRVSLERLVTDVAANTMRHASETNRSKITQEIIHRPSGFLRAINVKSSLSPVRLPPMSNDNNKSGEIIDSVKVLGRQPPPPPAAQKPSRRRHAIVPKRVTYRKAIVATASQLEMLANTPYHLGAFNQSCDYCGALFFVGEKRNRAENRLSCCNNGAYTFPPYMKCPEALTNLYTGLNTECTEFRREIRTINSLFAMASFKTSRPGLDTRGQQGHWCFSVCGEIYHMLGGIPGDQELRNPTLNQYYFLDTEEALEKRINFLNNRVSPDLLRAVEIILRNNNQLIKAYEILSEEIRDMRAGSSTSDNNGSRASCERGLDGIIIIFVKEPDINSRLQNSGLPTSRSKISAIIEGNEPPFDVDLVLFPHNPSAIEPRRRHQGLKNSSPFTDPMVYPLLFPCGDIGYSTNIYYKDKRKNGNGKLKTVTINEYYRYRLHVRGGFSPLFNGGKLFQQWLVDSFVKVDDNRLRYLETHQHLWRMGKESVLRQLNNARNALPEPLARIGQSVKILPSSYIGGDRYHRRKYLDAMTIVGRHGKPDLFITMTCNPKWPEITTNLGSRQKWEHRPDLLCRVFKSKLGQLMDDLFQKQIFGVVLNYEYVIEFQKRGLPHAHIIVTFDADDKINDIDQVDAIIHATIPDERAQPSLYNLVKQYHVHGPCGTLYPRAACMKDKQCSKFYPKPYCNFTSLNAGDNQRPQYKRPADGRTIHLENFPETITNCSIVPYNPYILCKYHCHTNIEVVGSLSAIRYLHKYIRKGSDFYTISVGDDSAAGDSQKDLGIDEIRKRREFRYVTSMESTWRLFNFPLHKRSHSVLVLPIHLPGDRMIMYDELEDKQEIQEHLDNGSKLLAFFQLNNDDIAAREFLYQEIPEHYTWDGKDLKWKQRRQVSKQFGCMVEVSPSSDDQLELFFLSILLSRIRGPISFDYLKTLDDGRVTESFRDACRLRNFIKHEDEYDRCLSEAALKNRPKRLRKLFANLCCVTSDEGLGIMGELWAKFRLELIKDYLSLNNGDPDTAEKYAFNDVQRIVRRNRPLLSLKKLGFQAIRDWNLDIIDKSNIDVDNRYLQFNNDLPARPQAQYDPKRLNADQSRIFLHVIKFIAINCNLDIPPEVFLKFNGVLSNAEIQAPVNINDNLMYIDGPGGTGKTHLYNTIIKFVKDTFNKRVISVAWSGIAANLLIGGSTVHRAFKLAPNITESTTAGWFAEAEQSRDIVDNVALIVWDEASMTPSLAVEAVDRYLRDICKKGDVPMGGKCCVFGGDFRQILPVVEFGHKFMIINACLKSSTLWKSIVKFQLAYNMRSRDFPQKELDLGERTFAEWVLLLGNGQIPYVNLNQNATLGKTAPSDLVEIPNSLCLDTVDQLVEFVFNNDFTNLDNGSRAILCPTNTAVAHVNEIILKKIKVTEKTYYSENEYKGEIGQKKDDFHVNRDLLNSICSPSLPPHELKLKIGVIVILLRNIDVGDGICNGTRLQVTFLGDSVIECKSLSGQSAGSKFYIFRMKIRANDTALPKEVIRTQFPLKLAYAITINKAQGQSLSQVGIFLNKPCFAAGQLYVALSRVGSKQNVRIVIEDGNKQGKFKFRGRRFTRNVVYPEILSDDIAHLQSITDNATTRICGNLGVVEPDIIKTNIVSNNVSNNETNILDDDDDLWKRGVPKRSRSQLEARVATEDRPGTSSVYTGKDNDDSGDSD